MGIFNTIFKKGEQLDANVTFNESTKDEDLVTVIEDWIKESITYHDELLQKQTLAENYYLGYQTMKAQVPDHLSDTVENRIFEGVETLTPIVTSATHQFMILPGSETEASVERAKRHQKVLSVKYRTLDVQKKLEEVVRHLLLFRFGVIKWGWSSLTDDLDIRVIDPRLILVPKLRCDPHDLPYKIEIQEYAPEEMKDYFPDVSDETLEEIRGTVSKVDKGQRGSEPKKTFEVFEIWTSDYVVWYSNGKILRKDPNPYYDFEGTETTKVTMGKNGKPKKVKDTTFTNFLDDPRDPFVFFSTFNIGGEPFGNISLTEVVLDISDEINVQKRQIINNLSIMGNARILMDKDAMSEEEAQSITNEPGLIIMGEGLVSGNKARVEQPVQLSNAFFANLQDSKMAFDNVFGLHSASRGAAASKTLGQDILNRQQDLTRIDLITRVLNRGVQRLAEGLTQLMKMYYTETHVFKILGDEGAVEFVKLNSGEIEGGSVIEVKAGRSPEFDRMQMATQAIQLYQLGALAPIDLYKLTELPNPEQMELNLLSWKTGQLSMETQAKIAESQAGAGAPGGGQPGAQPEAMAEGQGRGTESSANVLQRARKELGGSAPSPQGISN